MTEAVDHQNDWWNLDIDQKRQPVGWYLTRILRATEILPLKTSHLGVIAARDSVARPWCQSRTEAPLTSTARQQSSEGRICQLSSQQ
ncbi:hypothetical protein KL933_004030 [Ogataea haglerorum]|uniref:Uncharacterized protein n=1 Tax=Ogataea haglerorum TaxID=1937702 RepID=A0AAN6D441_9ASCO|nr:hypothetical protein KL933_004030 [Ogataea haglerorum]